jgi:hypothetical protein
MDVDVLLYAHEAIRSHVRLIVRKLSEETAEKIPGSLWPDLKAIINELDDGLIHHLAYEEEVLPGLIGGILMGFLISEHRKIATEIDEISLFVNLPDTPRNQLEDKALRKKISDFIDYLLEHCQIEDSILRLLRRNSVEAVSI